MTAASGRRAVRGDGIAAVVFDLDGTLIDSFDAIAASVNHARVALGHAALAPGDVHALVGYGLERLIAATFPAPDRERAVALYRRHHGDTAATTTRLLPGVRATLAALHDRGFRLGVATNKPVAFARMLLDHLDVAPHLAAVVGGDEVAEPKPDPAMLLAVLVRLAVEPARAFYVGDMHVDVLAGRAAGVAAVAGVTTGAATRAELLGAGASLVVDRLDELVDILTARPFG